jgi:hypothetical protein
MCYERRRAEACVYLMTSIFWGLPNLLQCGRICWPTKEMPRAGPPTFHTKSHIFCFFGPIFLKKKPSQDLLSEKKASHKIEIVIRITNEAGSVQHVHHDRVGEVCVCLADARACPGTDHAHAPRRGRKAHTHFAFCLPPGARVWNHGTNAQGGRELDTPHKSSAPAGSRRP